MQVGNTGNFVYSQKWNMCLTDVGKTWICPDKQYAHIKKIKDTKISKFNIIVQTHIWNVQQVPMSVKNTHEENKTKNKCACKSNIKVFRDKWRTLWKMWF